MKRTAALVSLLALGVFAEPAAAAPDQPHLNWGSQVTPAQCPTDQNYRYLEINVTHQVTNDADSGVAGNYWARDDYNRHIQVWKIGTTGGGEEIFCALVRYQGSFISVAGTSPAGTANALSAGVDGTFEGGYRAVIVGTENESPVYRRRGNIGAFDYGWSGDATQGPTTPFSWLGAYFSSVSSFSFEWWGWVYHGGSNGTWVNSSDGNQGDITD
jgi:hypothetical protein